MVHEAMVLEYSGRHLALIELASSLKLLLYLSLIACLFLPGAGAAAAGALRRYVRCVHRRWGSLCSQTRFRLHDAGAIRNGNRQDARVPGATFLGAALMLGFLGALLLFVSRGL